MITRNGLINGGGDRNFKSFVEIPLRPDFDLVECKIFTIVSSSTMISSCRDIICERGANIYKEIIKFVGNL